MPQILIGELGRATGIILALFKNSKLIKIDLNYGKNLFQAKLAFKADIFVTKTNNYINCMQVSKISRIENKNLNQTNFLITLKNFLNEPFYKRGE